MSYVPVAANTTAIEETTGGDAVRRRSSAIKSPAIGSAAAAVSSLLDSSSGAGGFRDGMAGAGSQLQPRRRSSVTSVPTITTGRKKLTYEQIPTTATKATFEIEEAQNEESDEGSHDDDLHDGSNGHYHGESLPESSPATTTIISPYDYYLVLRNYPFYRAYLISHICQNMGDWFVRIASILVVEELAARGGGGGADDKNDTGSGDGKTLSHLVLSTLLPRAIFSQMGGVIADKYDKRQLMILLDVLSGIVVLGYLLAIQYNSLPLIFVVTTIRSALGALYYPITTGIMPQLIQHSVVDLQIGVTINSWAWSCTSILGGLLAGTITASIGLSSCYIIDCITFFISAFVMYKGVRGNFKVGSNNNLQAQQDEDDEIVLSATSPVTNPMSLLRNIYTVFQQLVTYLWTCGFGLLVFQKSAASFVWGIEDIVGAEFSTVFDSETGEEDEEESSWNMGLLFSSIGLGCMVGPAIVNMITSADKPYSLQRACVIGLCFLTIGWFSIGSFAINTRQNQYYIFLFFTFIRTMGSGIVWVNATLIMQTLSEKHILGRVLAAEYTLATLSEALSSTISGSILADKYGYNKNQLALFGSLLGVCVVLFWGTYYVLGRGAASSRFNKKKAASISSTSIRRNGSII